MSSPSTLLDIETFTSPGWGQNAYVVRARTEVAANEAQAMDLEGLFERSWRSYGMLVLQAAPAQLLPLVRRLHGEFGFALFLDVTAVDLLPRVPRFDVVYHLLCPARRQRVRLKVAVTEQDPTVPTLEGVMLTPDSSQYPFQSLPSRRPAAVSE